MIRTISAFALATTLTLATAGSVLAGGLDAHGRPTFLIPARDGYGVADCLTRGDACAVQVANAWCAAQGYHHAADLRVVIGEGDTARSDAIAVTCDN